MLNNLHFAKWKGQRPQVMPGTFFKWDPDHLYQGSVVFMLPSNAAGQQCFLLVFITGFHVKQCVYEQTPLSLMIIYTI